MTAPQISPSQSEINRNLCQKCRSFRNLCGKSVCPILVKAKSIAKIEQTLKKRDFFGASPPGFFVGEYGYPKVNVGPLVPPIASEDTSIFDAEEQWITKTIEDIIGYRTSLIRGKTKLFVQSAAHVSSRVLETAQELIMAGEPIDTEMSFIKRPKLDIVFPLVFRLLAPLG